MLFLEPVDIDRISKVFEKKAMMQRITDKICHLHFINPTYILMDARMCGPDLSL